MFSLLTWTCCLASAQAVDLVADPGFKLGFVVKDGSGKEHLLRSNESVKPIWTVAQHHSKSAFAADEAVYYAGGLGFKDRYQSLLVHPADSDADVIFGVNAYNEFNGQYRQKGDTWPHQYVSQRISEPRGHLGDASPRVADLERVDLNIGVRLLYDRPNKTAAYNPRLHAAQFLLFLTIQNLNRKSPGYGDYYWFGVALYDSRYPVTSLHAMQDKGSEKKKGTDKLIYSLGLDAFTKEVVADGRWVTVRGDLLPHIRAGLAEAWKRGFLSGSTDPADYRIGSLVLGWEITGLNDAAIAVKDLLLTAAVKGP